MEALESTAAPAIEGGQLRIAVESENLAVDRHENVIRGFVVAQLGSFKTAGRGEFDERSLRQIVRLIKAEPDGLASYYGHATMAEPEQLGKFLGRAKSPRIETISARRGGDKREVQAVLADLHISPTAFEGNPNGNIGKYIMDLAETDPRSFAASLTLDAVKEYRLNRGRPVTDEQGNNLPPLWRPLELASIDIVRAGEAVDSFLPARLSSAQAMEKLSADPEHAEHGLCELLNTQFHDQPREVVKARLSAFVDRYLDYRFGEPQELAAEPEAETQEPPPTTDWRDIDLYLIEQEAW